MEGWIKLHRKIMDNPYYFVEPFTKSQAWIDLLLIANNRDGFYYKRGIKVNVKRGQVGYEVTSLSQRWRWSRGKAKRFLDELEMDRQIVQQKNNVTTLITISNYDYYQLDGIANGTANDTANGIANGRANGHKQEYSIDYYNTTLIEKGGMGGKTLPSWRTDFSIYLKECKEAFGKLYDDKEFISKQQLFYPNVNIKKTIHKAYENFWGTEAGWKNKKQSRSKTIDWKQTIVNSLSMSTNKVYYTKEELVQ